MKMCRCIGVGVTLIAATGALASQPSTAVNVHIGSKKFTESVLLGHVLTQLARSRDAAATYTAELGGTRILWDALLAGRIDGYPEYTGTIRREILGLDKTPPASRADAKDRNRELERALAPFGVSMTAPLGFENNYALGMRRETADRLHIRTISQLASHRGLRLAFTNEFINRSDGWPGLRDTYGFAGSRPRGLDHDLAYRALEAGGIDATDFYSTDAEIAAYDFIVLRDDRGYFPRYAAVVLYRTDLEQRAPAVVTAWKSLAGRILTPSITGMNAAAKIDHVPEQRVAAEFLARTFGKSTPIHGATTWTRLRRRTVEHLSLVGISLTAAVLVALPLGILAAKRRRWGQGILAIVGIVQTVPSLALLVFMIPLLGIGGPPAIAALFLYSLLPIVRNTHSGLTSIPTPLTESADALGLRPSERLRRIELPLAAGSILAGIKTSAVINIGTATLGALIGAGGYGQPILTGIRLNDTGLILEGAIPAALLALAVQGLFDLIERGLVPTGLRLRDS